MVRRTTPTDVFWNFIGLAIFILSIGVAWSLIRASTYKLETANHKLEVNSAANRVKEVSDKINREVEALPIPSPVKAQFQQELEQADEKLIEIKQEILKNEDSTSEP